MSTVGRIQPHLEVKIVDAAGRIVPVGQPGELCTRGYAVMRGYWEDDARTRESIDAAGWMHSGDLATIDAAGYCNIVGRVKDMLIRGGENVYPREIEEYLLRHPRIADVQVFGVPDAKYGEEVCAWVIPRHGQALSEEEVRDFCQGQIAHYKVPRYVRIVTEFPLTATGKPQKFEMRKAMMDALGLARRAHRVDQPCGSRPPAGEKFSHGTSWNTTISCSVSKPPDASRSAMPASTCFLTLTLRPVPRRISTNTKSSVRRVRTSGNVGSNWKSSSPNSSTRWKRSFGLAPASTSAAWIAASMRALNSADLWRRTVMVTMGMGRMSPGEGG